ncbi:MAG: hypothetical protein RRB13_06920 [bacterium]|nr:hypothetical protein [bacterium]
MSETDLTKPSPESTATSETRPTVYMVPHPKLAEKEIQVVDVVMPTLRYKWQVLIITALGVALGIFVSLRYGETLYTDHVVYHYQRPPVFHRAPVTPAMIQKDQDQVIKDTIQMQSFYPHSFFPDQRLMRPQSLFEARELLEKHFPIPRNASAEQLGQIFDGADYVKFDSCNGCLLGTKVLVRTNSPRATHEALQEFDQFYRAYNAQLNQQQYRKLAAEVQAEINDAAEHRLAQISMAGPIYFSSSNGVERFFLEFQGQNYLMELRHVAVAASNSAKQQAPKRNAGERWRLLKFTKSSELGNQASQVTGQIARLKRQGGLLGDKALEVYQKFFALNQRYTQQLRQLEESKAQIKALEQAEALDDAALKQQRAVSTQQAQVAFQLESERSQWGYSAEMLFSRLEGVLRHRALMANYTTGEWVEVSAEQQPAKTEDAVIDYSFHERLDFWLEDLVRLEELYQLYDNLLFAPFDLVKSPSLDTIEVTYRLNFKRNFETPGEAKQLTYDDFKPIILSKKILALFLVVALVLAILSAMLRAYLNRASEAGQLGRLIRQLKESLLSWKL